MKTEEQFRNCNMGSLLISAWLDFCLNNGIEYIGVNNRQRKPFILYMLKTYAFDVVSYSEWLTDLRNEILKDTLEKIDAE